MRHPRRPVDGEKINLSHGLAIYAMVLSVPLAIFQPPALFDSLHAIVAGFGIKL